MRSLFLVFITCSLNIYAQGWDDDGLPMYIHEYVDEYEDYSHFYVTANTGIQFIRRNDSTYFITASILAQTNVEASDGFYVKFRNGDIWKKHANAPVAQGPVSYHGNSFAYISRYGFALGNSVATSKCSYMVSIPLDSPDEIQMFKSNPIVGFKISDFRKDFAPSKGKALMKRFRKLVEFEPD